MHPTEGQVGKSLLVKSLCLICAVWPGLYVLGTSAEYIGVYLRGLMQDIFYFSVNCYAFSYLKI